MEKFLQMKHAENYMGTDDDMPEAFSEWLVDLDVDKWVKYADEYAEEQSSLSANMNKKNIDFDIVNNEDFIEKDLIISGFKKNKFNEIGRIIFYTEEGNEKYSHMIIL